MVVLREPGLYRAEVARGPVLVEILHVAGVEVGHVPGDPPESVLMPHEYVLEGKIR